MYAIISVPNITLGPPDKKKKGLFGGGKKAREAEEAAAEAAARAAAAATSVEVRQRRAETWIQGEGVHRQPVRGEHENDNTHLILDASSLVTDA